MLGIGMQEMMLIALAALLIFGPGKLPEVMGQAGKLYKDFRNMTSELTGEFDKTIAEAKKLGDELTGDLGPMQKQVNSVTKSVQRDLGKGSKSTSTTRPKTTTGTKSSTSSSTAAKKSTTSRTSSTKSTSSSTSATRTSAAKSTTSTAAKKPTVAPVATKEDPHSDLSMFALEEPTRTRRTRRATPSVITDPTPREMAMADSVPESDGGPAPSISPVNDAIARARQRRQNAGYAQRSA